VVTTVAANAAEHQTQAGHFVLFGGGGGGGG
jgi:hypothetical protein